MHLLFSFPKLVRISDLMIFYSYRTIVYKHTKLSTAHMWIKLLVGAIEYCFSSDHCVPEIQTGGNVLVSHPFADTISQSQHRFPRPRSSLRGWSQYRRKFSGKKKIWCRIQDAFWQLLLSVKTQLSIYFFSVDMQFQRETERAFYRDVFRNIDLCISLSLFFYFR